LKNHQIVQIGKLPVFDPELPLEKAEIEHFMPMEAPDHMFVTVS
jgi:hypothetical protein